MHAIPTGMGTPHYQYESSGTGLSRQFGGDPTTRHCPIRYGPYRNGERVWILRIATGSGSATIVSDQPRDTTIRFDTTNENTSQSRPGVLPGGD